MPPTLMLSSAFLFYFLTRHLNFLQTFWRADRPKLVLYFYSRIFFSNMGLLLVPITFVLLACARALNPILQQMLTCINRKNKNAFQKESGRPIYQFLIFNILTTIQESSIHSIPFSTLKNHTTAT